jgi:membrane-associated phospholipid phosphatase
VAENDRHRMNLWNENDEERASKFIARRRTRLFQAYVLGATIGFILLAFYANKIAYFPIDLLITRWVQTFHPVWFVTFMVLVSWPGYLPQALIIVIVLVSILFVFGFRWEAILSSGAALVQSILDIIIKLIVHRPRPGASLVHVMQILNSYSFPSGHVLFYSVFFGFLIFMIFSQLKASRLRSGLLLLFGSLVSLIGVSRIYLGEHWASDVLGAYLLGSLCLWAVIQIYRWREDRTT